MRNKKMKIILKMAEAGLVLFLIFLASNVFIRDTYARYHGRYSGKYDECVAESGYGQYRSVSDYACVAAARTDVLQEGCAAWLSAPGNPSSTTINVTKMSGAVPLAIYGMCSDDSGNTTSNLWLMNDNGSITPSSPNLTRGPWGSPNSISASLNIERFIAGVTPEKEGDYYVYTREVELWRQRGGNTTTDWEPAIIKIKMGGTEPPPSDDLCGAWTPDSYTSSNPLGGTTSVVIKDRNPRLSTVWDKSVFAKPEDTVEWYACYYPGVQATADTEVSRVNDTKVEEFEDLSKTECSDPPLELEFKPLKEAIPPLSAWQNQYTLSGDAEGYGNFTDTSLTVGDITTVPTEGMTRTIGAGDVGRSDIHEKIESGTPTNVSIDIPSEEYEEVTTADGICKNEYANGPSYNATVETGTVEDNADVIVPYNFVNSASVSVGSDLAYAGETVSDVSASYTISPRYNGKTEDIYATNVPNIKVSLIAYVSEHPGGEKGPFLDSTDGDACSVAAPGITECIKLINKDDRGGQGSYPDGGGGEIASYSELNAFDNNAGKYMCFVSAVWPASSGSAESTSGTDGKWQYSNPDCVIIAKKPTFQVWGGSLYSVGAIDANYSQKRNVYNKYRSDMSKFKTSGLNLNITLMPWVEQSLILKSGLTDTVASGAATGLNEPIATKTGSKKADFCKDLAPLSFANYGASLTSVCRAGGESVGNSGIDAKIEDRGALIEYWAGATEDQTPNTSGGTSFNLNTPGSVGEPITSALGTNVRYVYSTGSLTLTGSTVPKGTTYLIRSDDKVTIKGNIKYVDDGYSMVSEIPKVLIYAHNVDIECDAEEVDAIIITDDPAGTHSSGGTVKTCSNIGDINDPEPSHQLKVFGVAVTDKVVLDRTYGNAANEDGAQVDRFGTPSDGAAAEIFDYDTSILMWSNYMSSSAATDVLQTVYQHEVAPRY